MVLRELTVAQVRELISTLNENDVLIPNISLGLVEILRDRYLIGVIKFIEGGASVQLYRDDE